MQERYRIFRRAGGSFYLRDKVTGKSESLKTADRGTATQLLVAKNQAVAQSQLNRTMAKAYLSAKSPELMTRTWAQVMDQYVKSGIESTRDRKERDFRSRPFAMLRRLACSIRKHLLAVLEHKQAGNSTIGYCSAFLEAGGSEERLYSLRAPEARGSARRGKLFENRPTHSTY